MNYHCYSMNECNTVFQFLQQLNLDSLFVSVQNETDRLLKEKAEQILHDLGMPSSLAGFRFCVFALETSCSSPEILMNLNNTLYPMIAIHFGTSRCCVEKNIRKAIEITWLRADPERITEFFGCSVDPEKGKPSNSEFLTTLSASILI